MRGGLPLEKCIYNVAADIFFSQDDHADTVQPANCKFTWTYDLPFSVHMPFGTLCFNMKEDISDPAFTN